MEWPRCQQSFEGSNRTEPVVVNLRNLNDMV